MSVLRHTEADMEKRYAYLKMAKALRRSDENDDGSATDDIESSTTLTLSDDEFKKESDQM